MDRYLTVGRKLFQLELVWIILALVIAALSNHPLVFDGSNSLLSLLNTQQFHIFSNRYVAAIFQWPTLLASRFTESLPVLRQIFSFSYAIPVVPISLLLTYYVLPQDKKSYWNLILFGLIGGTILAQGTWVSENVIALQFSWPLLVLLLSDGIRRIHWLILALLFTFLYVSHTSTILIMGVFMIFMVYRYYEKGVTGTESSVKIALVATFIAVKVVDDVFLSKTTARPLFFFIRYMFPHPADFVRVCALYTPILVVVSAQYVKQRYAYIGLTVLFAASTIYLSLSNLATPIVTHGDVTSSSLLHMAAFAFIYSKNSVVSPRFIYLSRAAAVLFFIVISSLALLWNEHLRSVDSFIRHGSTRCIDFSKYREGYKTNGFADDWTGAVSLVLNDNRTLKKAILPEPMDCENFVQGNGFIYHRSSFYIGSVTEFTKVWFR